MFSNFERKIEIRERCKGVHCVDLGESFPTNHIFFFQSSPSSQSSFQIDPNSNEYFVAKIGVDTAENEPLEVWGENSIQCSLHSLGAPDALPRRVRGVRTRAFRAFFRRALVPPPRSCRLFMLIVKFLSEVGKNPITVEEHCGTS